MNFKWKDISPSSLCVSVLYAELPQAISHTWNKVGPWEHYIFY